MPNEYFEGLTYLETATTPVTGVKNAKGVPIKKVKVMHLLWLRCFLIKKVIDENNGMPLSIEDLNALIKSDYDRFHTTQWEIPRLMLPTHKNQANVTVRMNSPAVDSRKFIKPNVKNYPVLRDLHCFDQFEMELMTQASMDGIQNVFDLKYHPSTHEEKVNFNEKKKFAMSVLVHSMQTKKLCTVVQCYYHGGTAQGYWQEILQVVQYFRDLEFKSLHTKLVNIQFDDWPSDLVSFLLFWNDMMTLLAKLQSVSQQHPSCKVRKSLLVTALHDHPILAGVDKFEQGQVIHDLKSMSFAEYFDLLLCAAQQVDQEEDDNGLQHQLKHVVHDCELIQEGYEGLSLLPSAPDMVLSISDVQYSIGKKSPQVKFTYSNALYVFSKCRSFSRMLQLHLVTLVSLSQSLQMSLLLTLKVCITMDVILSMVLMVIRFVQIWLLLEEE